MEQVFGKTQSPKDQVVPFVWCVGGFSRYVNASALQAVKSFGESELTFHAYAFMRTHGNNEVYRDTVKLALAHLEKSKKVKP
jgi:hypothetical protein